MDTGGWTHLNAPAGRTNIQYSAHTVHKTTNTQQKTQETPETPPAHTRAKTQRKRKAPPHQTAIQTHTHVVDTPSYKGMKREGASPAEQNEREKTTCGCMWRRQNNCVQTTHYVPTTTAGNSISTCHSGNSDNRWE